MKTVTQYWNLVRLDSAGNSKITEIARAKELFFQQFPELIEREEVSNKVIQNDLVALKNHQDKITKIWSYRCLRCFISHQIKQICIQLEMQFGREHDFNRSDLFIYTLNDTLDNFRDSTVENNHSRYKPLAVEVLEKFDPKKATLSTWTIRIVKQNKEVQRFLLEKGVYLISNWAILNDTNPKQAERILAEFHNLTPAEITEYAILLESYHGVYRRDRLKNNRGRGEKCQTPSEEQLRQIANVVKQKIDLKLSTQQTLFNLEVLANNLREYRIYVRSGFVKREHSLDNSAINTESLQASVVVSEENTDYKSWLKSYQQKFQSSLNQSIAEVIDFKLSKFKGKKALKASQYLTALKLFHCQNKTMSEIASLVGLQAQYQVTRLLKLKELRADIRQKMLQIMKDWTLTESQKLETPQLLKEREQIIAQALAEQVDIVLEEAEKEASVPGSNKSVLARQICHHLDTKYNLKD